ncbi:hypothetical protein BBJ28_00026712 [Nothophytophthora sp. Chile5]|nr:hypothetical protein BBJ28_00026712 [Nothophytophthora sp. Chile5]
MGDAASASSLLAAQGSHLDEIRSAAGVPPRSDSVGTMGSQISARPPSTSALDMLSSASSAFAFPDVAVSSPLRSGIPDSAGSVPGSITTATESSVAVAFDCMGCTSARLSLPTLEPYQGPSLSRERIAAVLEQSHLLQMLDHDFRQLEGVNAALVRQNRTLSDHAAALHAQSLHHMAAVETNRDRDADFHRQQSAGYLESWWDAEEELERLVQELGDVRASNDDLNGQLLQLRRSSDVTYHDLQEELWAEHDTVR